MTRVVLVANGNSREPRGRVSPPNFTRCCVGCHVVVAQWVSVVRSDEDARGERERERDGDGDGERDGERGLTGERVDPPMVRARRTNCASSSGDQPSTSSYTYCDPPAPPKVFELDLYAILGVGIMASEEEIRQSWKKRAFENHPDRHANSSDVADATIRFQTVQHAYNVLKDGARRREYDTALLHRLHAEEYLGRCVDLLLTSSGLGLGMGMIGSSPEGNKQKEIGALTGQAQRWLLTCAVKRTKSYEDLAVPVPV